MTGFNTQVGGGEYRLQFETDNREHYELMQKTARQCVGTGKPITNADRIRAMSDEELALWLAEHQFLVAQTTCEILGVQLSEDRETVKGSAEENLEWLRQPVTQPHPGADDNHDHSGLLEE